MSTSRSDPSRPGERSTAAEAPLETLQSSGEAARGAWRDDIARLGPWFHNLHLPDGSMTAPDHPLGDFPTFKWRQIAPHLPRDMRGMEVLDIGCNAGFYSFELARRGAQVEGIDVSAHYLAQARWAAERFGLHDRVSFSQGDVYQLARQSKRYDLVLFMGVFYHLRYPLLALDIVAQRCRGELVFQSLSMRDEGVAPQVDNLSIEDRARLSEADWPKMAFIEHSFAADATNWWVPNRACVEAMLRDVGLRIRARPGDEIYLCKHDPELAQRARAHDDELRAATGQP